MLGRLSHLRIYYYPNNRKLKRKAEKTQTFSKYKNDENTSQTFKSKNSRKEFVVPVYKKIWYPSNLALRDILLFAFFKLYGFLVSYLIVVSLFVCKINSFGKNSKTALCV